MNIISTIPNLDKNAEIMALLNKLKAITTKISNKNIIIFDIDIDFVDCYLNKYNKELQTHLKIKFNIISQIKNSSRYFVTNFAITSPTTYSLTSDNYNNLYGKNNTDLYNYILSNDFSISEIIETITTMINQRSTFVSALYSNTSSLKSLKSENQSFVYERISEELLKTHLQ